MRNCTAKIFAVILSLSVFGTTVLCCVPSHAAVAQGKLTAKCHHCKPTANKNDFCCIKKLPADQSVKFSLNLPLKQKDFSVSISTSQYISAQKFELASLSDPPGSVSTVPLYIREHTLRI